ncbi:Di-sulfide bridge nucleocytoplasmic transport domain-containing protein [Lasiosphaeria hispida]|uniref:Di-sulfide bridge nucleocytoplasmic transport domain-containing protein n=1 Tax=Lasiosphaeria hispida TaxID=260671 RepID=A0AAJ0MJX9_9PEZI|nr:Di-sulfide bridge nucleocytoplasmic transport domain-containing protein [Lasiosphaeria hispida]
MSSTDKAPLFTASFNSPSKLGSGTGNTFGVGNAPRSSPFKQPNLPPPPARSFFNPQITNKPSAPAFRNPAFTTPQKRVDELVYSEYSGAESSPAMTDTSEMPPETPEVDHDDDFGKMTITPHTANKALFGKSMIRSRTPGRGEIPRASRDKVRKRKRQQGDRDVGSVRPRLPHASDDSDSDWEVDSKSGAKKFGKGKAAGRGWLSSFLAAVSDHPSAPAILSKWLQLGVNLVFMSIVLCGMLAIVFQIRSDLSSANEKARAELAQQMSLCSENYIRNQCAPKANRVPALDAQCNEWEACMNQDPAAIMKVQVSIRNMGSVLNEFTDVVTFKTWGFILSIVMVAIVGANIGFGFLRESALPHSARPEAPLHSQAANFPMLGAPQHQHNPGQAYIWAPISETPRHVRRNLLADDATDTDNSPDPMKAIMPPQTPSGRRSPSKGERERGRSPSKTSRSPSKGY